MGKVRIKDLLPFPWMRAAETEWDTLPPRVGEQHQLARRAVAHLTGITRASITEGRDCQSPGLPARRTAVAVVVPPLAAAQGKLVQPPRFR